LINVSVVLACFASAFGVRFANAKANSIRRVVIEPRPVLATPARTVPVGVAGTGAPTGATTTPARPSAPPVNFLVVGSDSRACIDPNAEDAGQFLAKGDTGDQSDTIMVLRVDPSTNAAAILSFPRDLFVKLAGSTRSAKINAAFAGGNATRLIQTIEENFTVPIDHYVQIDFCAFKNIVDAVGGIRIAFEYPARDTNSGLWVPEPGCVSFDGTNALRYARSRYFEWSTNGGRTWIDDGTADRGRIRRQQDFIKRVMQKAIDKGARRPKVAAKLLDATLKYVKFDSELQVNQLLDLASQLRSFDPATVRTFRIDGADAWVGDQQVIRPSFTSAATKQILALFRGEAPLVVGSATTTAAGSPANGADGPTTVAEAVTTVVVATTALAAATAPAAPARSTTSTSAAPLPGEDEVGYLPPDDPTCR
jgi:LCP family protein required for cell wall assembly